jgi:CHAD domain-containing protein
LVVIEDSGLRTDAAVKRILRGLHDTLRRNEPGTLAEIDTEFLHDYRVTVRRTRALLGQLGAAFPARVTDRFRRHFAGLAEVTGPARDWDVFLRAPGRAHLLGGESPLLARQGEELAERQGCCG